MSQTKKPVSVGQFWRDTSTRDILRIDKLSLEPISQKVKQKPVWIAPHEETVKRWKNVWVEGREELLENGDRLIVSGREESKPVEEKVQVSGYFIEGPWVDGPAEMVQYVRPSIYVRGRYFGMGADMKASHFETERYEYIPRLAAYWVLGLARLRALWK